MIRLVGWNIGNIDLIQNNDDPEFGNLIQMKSGNHEFYFTAWQRGWGGWRQRKGKEMLFLAGG